MARYVEDLSLALPLICGPDGRDPAVVPVPLGDPQAVDTSQLRIAWFADNGIVSPVDDIQRVVIATAKALRSKGFNLEQKLLPQLLTPAILCVYFGVTALSSPGRSCGAT